MKKLVIVITILVLCIIAFASLGNAQSAPGPRVNVAFDPPAALRDCQGGMTDPWTWAYGSCYLPPGVNLGDPYITTVRVTFAGATTVVSNVPKAQVVRETTTARCPGGATPCLRISDLAAPAGPSNVTLQFVTATGAVGAASAAFPFTGSEPAAPALTGARSAIP